MKSNKIYVGKAIYADLLPEQQAKKLAREALKLGGINVSTKENWPSLPPEEALTAAIPEDFQGSFTVLRKSNSGLLFQDIGVMPCSEFVNKFAPSLLIYDARNGSYSIRNLSKDSLIANIFNDTVTRIKSYDFLNGDLKLNLFKGTSLPQISTQTLFDSGVSDFSELSRGITSAVESANPDLLAKLAGKSLAFIVGNCVFLGSVSFSGGSPEFSFSQYFLAIREEFFHDNWGIYIYWYLYSTSDFQRATLCCTGHKRTDNCELTYDSSSSFGLSLPQDFPQTIDYLCVPFSYEYAGGSESSDKYRSEDLLNSDNRLAALPVMPEAKLTSSSEGLFDIFWNDSNTPNKEYYFPLELDRECTARDPWELVKNSSRVTIDFGTSSTVVATRDEYGRVSLVRMGGFDQAIKDSQYENPTVLDFVNLRSFLKYWRDVPFRPHTSFADLEFSHTAKEGQNDHPRSCMNSIKTWCRTDRKGIGLRLMDEQGLDFELIQPDVLEDESKLLQDFVTADVNPVEIYAYLLGCCINNQSLGNGSIYLNYTMTFPVKFDNDTKKRILQGFRKGLLRSLPPSLVYSNKWKDSLLEVKERASEPIALAASYLKALEISPADSGVPFGVFDFGGGTADFAVGLYRNPSDEEADEYDYEQVIDIIDTSGDPDLGGEHLVSLICYETIRDNLPEILSKKIKFVLPQGLTAFPGSELVWATSSEASENSAVLAKELRDLWEAGRLIDAEGNAITNPAFRFKINKETPECNFTIDQEKLLRLMADRIKEGFARFRATIQNAMNMSGISFADLGEFQVFFSGNSCRSPITKAVIDDFRNNSGMELKLAFHTEFIDMLDTGDAAGEAEIPHEEVPAAPEVLAGAVEEAAEEHPDDDDEDEDDNGTAKDLLAGIRLANPLLTLKTGVALGLLSILEGESTGYVERIRTSGQEGEAPFNYYVGKFVKGILNPTLARNADYVSWVKLDKVKKTCVTKLGWSSDPTVITKNPNAVTKEYLVHHDSRHTGWNIFIKPESPGSIAVAVTQSDTPDDLEDIKIITL